MSRTAELIAIEDKYGAHNYHPLDVVLAKGEGIWVWDVEGKKYMDFLAAYSAVNQGHNHTRIVGALVEQLAKLALTSRAFRNDIMPLYYEKVTRLLGYQRVCPMNTGAEAVETAVKLARKWGYRVKGIPAGKAEIIVCEGNFHGRTITVISFSSEPQYKDGFEPLTPGFRIIPYGDIKALEAAITPNTCAFLVEPIQGEAGVVVPPAGYLKAARELCTKHRVLLIADEIQSGLGRTGKMLASEHEGVRPDMVTLGKALAGGVYPVSAVLADSEIMDMFQPGDHGSTFGGNPIACAVAMEALDVLVEEKLPQRAAKLGDYLIAELRKIQSPHVDFYRGKGLWIGIVLKHSAGGARRFCEALQQKGILAKETHQNVIRLAPPLVITEDELDWAIEKLDEVLRMK